MRGSEDSSARKLSRTSEMYDSGKVPAFSASSRASETDVRNLRRTRSWSICPSQREMRASK